MSDLIPMNELDRAIKAMARTQAAFPDFCRALCKGDLWFLRPFQVGMTDEPSVIKKGEPYPFTVLNDPEGESVPVFSSEARAEEGMRNGNVPALTYVVGSLPAMRLLAMLGGTKFGAVVNKSCPTGEIYIDSTLMRDLANGTALKPAESDASQHKQREVSVLDPADYPTEMIQRAFEFMLRHRNFRAAWVLGMEVSSRPSYMLAVLMQPHDAVLFHDFNLTVHVSHSKDYDTYLKLLDKSDPECIGDTFCGAPVFYVAADYQRPPGAKV